MKRLFEREVLNERFNLKKLYSKLLSKLAADKLLFTQVNVFLRQNDPKLANAILISLIRFAFLIELVKKPAIETTKFKVQWTKELLKDKDIRYCSYDDCLDIFKNLLNLLIKEITNSDHCDLFKLFYENTILPYELPVDYKERFLDKQIHSKNNCIWIIDKPDVSKTIKLRQYVVNSKNIGKKYSDAFKAALFNKIKVKTYLTDRVLTGAHKTNREKRWEVNPASVHFATRLNCLRIEHELLQQLCFFKGFPLKIRRKLLDLRLIDKRPETRCPVTLLPLNFKKFIEEVSNPRHGKSNFHVGHLNPLKAKVNDERSGHTYKNISWISHDGNRIQGSLSLAKARALLKLIAKNYGSSGWQNP